MTLPPGTRLGVYEILEPLGAGGMGEVYRAKDAKLERDVAIKVLPDSVAQDPEALSRFEREAKAVAALSHPNVLAIHDYGTQGGVAYAVMELLQGRTLRDRLKAGPIPPKQAVEYAIQIAKGLAAAHEKGIVHRDLKPENVFVTRDGHVTILDFGLAKRTDAAEPEDVTSASTKFKETAPGTVMGTVGYMSPEQVRGLAVDHRSDIFAFGAIVYEMLSGRRAFRGASLADTMSAILKDEPPELVEMGRGVPPALDHAVRHCLEKDPSDRFQTAKDVAFALTEASSSWGAGSARRWPVIESITVLILLAAASFTLLRLEPSAGPKRMAVLPFENLGSPDQEYFADGMADEVRGKLTSVASLEVIARGSSTPYKKTTKPAREIAQELGVTYLLNGTIRWDRGTGGGRVQVTPELVEVKGKGAPASRWQKRYEAELTDVFKVQSDIAAKVASELGVALERPGGRPLSEGSAADAPGENAEAYTLYLQGKHFADLRTRESLEKAVSYFQQALRLDPGSARAWAGLAAAHRDQAAGDNVAIAEGYRRAREAVEKALELDPNLAEAHAALGWIRRSYDWDWPGADAALKRALELEPGNTTVIRRAAALAATLGRFEEAIRLDRRAVALDPLEGRAHFGLGLDAWYARRLDEAETAFRKALELNPEYPGGHAFLGVVLLARSKPEAALEEVEREREPFWHRFGLALASHALARKEEADAALGELLEKDKDAWAFQIAEVYAFRSQIDMAFEWLERAYAQRDSGLAAMKGDPLLKSLETDSRYLAFVKKMGLPH